MVDKSGCTPVACKAYAVFKGIKGIDGRKGIGKFPAYDLMGECIREKMKIHHSVIRVYIGDICNPQAVYAFRSEVLDEVGILAVAVIGVRSMTPAFRLEHKAVVMHKRIETVTAGHADTEYILEHYKKLVCAQSGSLRTDLLYHSDYFVVAKLQTPAFFTADGIITLSRLPKQSAQASDTCLWMPETEVIYCLAPAFFSRSTPYFSLPNFSTS